jgi:hypothetical protein
MDTASSPDSINANYQAGGIISVSELLKKSFQLNVKIFWKFIATTLLPALGIVPGMVLIYLAFILLTTIILLGNTTLTIAVAVIVGLLVIALFIAIIYLSFIAQAAIMTLIASVNFGQEVTVWQNFKNAKKYAHKLVIVNLITGLSIYAWSLLFVIPGFVYMIFYSLSQWTFMGEGFAASSAKARSEELITGLWWPVALRYLALLGIEFAMLLPLIVFAKVWWLSLIWTMVFFVFNIFMIPFPWVYSFYLYMDLAGRRKDSAVIKKEKGGGYIIVVIIILFLAFASIPVLSFLALSKLNTESGSRLLGFSKQENQSMDILENLITNDSIEKAKIKSRDSKRISDIKQIQTALELYYNDKNEYPDNIEFGKPFGVYMSELPINPKPNDGVCPQDQEYTYLRIDKINYEINYCLGEDTLSNGIQLKAGINNATPRGLANE